MVKTVVWFRRDLRISDHAPLSRAVRRGAVIPVFVLDAALLHHPETAVARVAFMLECLQALEQDLLRRGGKLVILRGDPLTCLPELVRQTEAEGIYAYLDYERAYGRVRDAQLNQLLQNAGIKIRWFEPQGGIEGLVPHRVFREQWFQTMREPLIPTPENISVPPDLPPTPVPTLADLNLQPDAKPIPPGGTEAARSLLEQFFADPVYRYYWQLSYPSAEVTSGLSPYLKFGVISPRECYQRAAIALGNHPDMRVQRSYWQFVSRLRWGCSFTQRFRYLPQLEIKSLYALFDEEGWDFNPDWYDRWQQGQTGWPIVDAAARCLQATGGWKSLNFRVRAIYASTLGNLLGIDWRYGALHFMRHLIDGDCPIDHYQWAMQTGITHGINLSWTRIYNPEQTAVDRCDPEGAFIKQWVPELAHLPPKQLGLPPATPGYPPPILNYREARHRRVAQLERQRQALPEPQNILPALSPLPQSWEPFAAQTFSYRAPWLAQDPGTLFPAALALEDLSAAQIKDLSTWFMAPTNRGSQKRTRKSKRSEQSPSPYQQLSLFPNL